MVSIFARIIHNKFSTEPLAKPQVSPHCHIVPGNHKGLRATIKDCPYGYY